MTDLKKSEKPNEPNAGKTVVRLALYVDVPVDLPEGCELETLTADDGKTTVGIPFPESIVATLEAIRATPNHRDASAILGGTLNYLAKEHPDFTANIDPLVGFDADTIMELMTNG